MKAARQGVIDIGTNSVKVLVADVAGLDINPLLEASEQTRLGKGFYETHRLQRGPIEHTARAVASFAELGHSLGVPRPWVIATSAVRDAHNRDDLIEAVDQVAGLPVHVISGEEEAEWVFQGVTTDPRLRVVPLLLLDVGGGSTEMILGEKGHYVFRQSFPMGSVRLLEKLRPHDPPSLADLAGCRTWLTDYFNHEVGPALEEAAGPRSPTHPLLIGTGGTTTLLARMQLKMTGFDRQALDGLRLTQRQVLSTMVDLWSQPLAQRKKIVGLPPNRADVILMGVAIYEAVMVHFQFHDLYVSTRGLRFGALLQQANLSQPDPRPMAEGRADS